MAIFYCKQGSYIFNANWVSKASCVFGILPKPTSRSDYFRLFPLLLYIVIIIFTDGAESGEFPMFTIQSELGMVTVAGNLDYETKSEYNLNISATDGESVAYCSVSSTQKV